MAEVQRPITPNRLYRFRSLTRNSEAVDQEIDSIVSRYLYCSEFSRMNDPMEGFYKPSKVLSGKSDYKDIVRQITRSKSGIGIACFTETYEDVLMWTHYAGNYSGMCLSYSTNELVEGLSDNVRLVRLAYVDEPPTVYPSNVSNSDNAATRVLSQKKYNWSYEREWRVLASVGRVTVGRVQPIKAIYFGSRVHLPHRQRILSKIQGMGIKAYMMDVDGYSHTWDPINAAAKKQKQTKA